MPLPDFVDLHKKEEEETPWLISFSDMMCLLLCFFIVLVAMSELDLVKIEMLTQHFARPERITMRQLQQMIQEFIDSERLQDQVSVRLTSKGVEISFKDKLLFDLGQATLKPVALSILEKISGLLNYKEISQRKIYVEGHTDSLPIKSTIFPSNWELSSGRAANVVKFFTARGLDSRRFEAIGYADTQPVKPEIDKILGQPENRRVVIVISPESYLSRIVRKEISVGDFQHTIKHTTPTFPTEPEQTKQITKFTITPDKIKQMTTLPDRPKQTIIPPDKPKQDIVTTDKKVQMENYFSLGQKYFLEGKYKEAINAWKKVLELNPEHQLSKRNIQRARRKLSQK